jgi:hypothetical protein
VKKFIEFYESAIKQNMRSRESRAAVKKPRTKAAVARRAARKK